MRVPVCTRSRRLALLFAAAAALAAPARADAPCADDAARLCPGIPQGDRRLWACLSQHALQLSGACQENMREVQRRAAELDADCAADVYRFCQGVQPGEGRILGCLGGHVGQRELSTNCEDTVSAALAKAQEFVDACTQDAARLCPDVPPGGGRVFVCLRAQPRKLSTRCLRAVNP
jgi:Golgi apparatus protein 1